MFLRDKPKGMTECVDFYLDDCLARGQSDRTVEGKRSALKAFAAWCLSEGIRRPSRIAEADLEAYRRYLYGYRQPFTHKPLDIATQRNRLTAVKVFLGRLKRHGILKDNPAADMELPRRPQRLPKAILTEAEIEAMMHQAILHGTKGIRDRAVLETYYSTGIRRMELANLDIGDFDAQSELLTVRRGKGQKDRRVPIARRASEWIVLYLQDIRPTFARLESGKALFLADDGLRFREQQLTRLASKYVKRAGIDKPGACNLFRHATGTLMHENGADILYVKEMLGHADVSTTQIYIQVSRRKLREVYAKTHPAARSRLIARGAGGQNG